MTDTSPMKAKKSVYPLLLGEKLRARLDEMAIYYEKSIAEIIRDAVNFKYLEEYMKHTRGYGKGTEDKTPRGPNKAQRITEILAITDYDALNAELERLHVFEHFKSTPDMWVRVADDGAGGRTVLYSSPRGDSGNLNFGEIIKVLQKII